MKIISLPRGGGKTSMLLKLSAEKGYVIVTRNEESCEHLLKRAEESKITIPQPISYWDFLRKGKNFDYRKKYVIDNLDSMFEANADVVLATISSVKEDIFSLQTIFNKRPESVFVKFDGLDEAIIGFEDSSERLIYSVKKCIEILSRDMGYEEAVEFFDYNVRNSHIGHKTPILCDDNF